VSEKILNGTSAQLGYTAPFTLNVVEHTGQKTNYKTDTLQKQPREENKAKYTAKQNYPGSVAFMTLGQETRWAYSTMLPSSHRASNYRKPSRTPIKCGTN